jgi:hypothetical protein
MSVDSTGNNLLDGGHTPYDYTTSVPELIKRTF